MVKKISPPLESLERLRQPLNSGEIKVFNFLNEHLSSEWEIYIHPHMNGLCPDFVLLNPKIGIQIIEVKDWKISASPWRWKQDGKNSLTLLRCSQSGCWFSEKRDPFSQLLLYRDEFVELYCPRLGASLAKRFGKKFPVLSACISLPNEPRSKVFNFLYFAFEYYNIRAEDQAIYWPIISADEIEEGNIGAAVPFSLMDHSKFMKEEYAEDLRHWLEEPDLQIEQRSPLILDKRQKLLAESRTNTGYRRIRGAAGSGKSHVLAARAAKLSSKSKRILVVTYNITLGNYLRDLIVRGGLLYNVEKPLNQITILNFHRLAKRICIQSGNKKRYNDLWKSGDNTMVLKEDLAKLTKDILSDKNFEGKGYDAILVDEGQDFRLSWWQCLQKLVKKNGEMILVVDRTQNIYRTPSAWTDTAMIGTGFRGEWAELLVSYRLPDSFIPYVADFAERYISKEERTIPRQQQRLFDFENTRMSWLQVEGSTNQLCSDTILKIFTSEINSAIKKALAYSDVIFLSANNETGLDVVSRLNKKNIKVSHTFDRDSKTARRKKMAFYLGAEKVKATTIHSFKGWESRILVIQIHPVSANSQKEHAAAVYAALTRLKVANNGPSFIAVICSDPLFAEYGNTWPQSSFC